MKKIILFIILILLISIPINAQDKRLPTNEISMSFENMNIRSVFSAMTASNGLNVVIEDGINENISFNLDKVPFSQAVNLIAGLYDLDYNLKNNVLVIKRAVEENLDTGSATFLVSNYEVGQTNMILNRKIEEEKPFADQKGINAGTLIPARLEVGLVSSNEKTPAIVRVMEDMTYKGEVLIPKGSLFKGVGTADYNVRQIFVELDTLILADREIKIKAHMIKDDGTPGFMSDYIDKEMENYFPNLLMRIAGGIGKSLKSNSYVYDQQGRKVAVEEGNLTNDMLDSSADSLNEFADKREQDAQAQKAIISVNAGIKGFVFIDEKIPLEYFKKGDE